jgi:hypothetical protein
MIHPDGGTAAAKAARSSVYLAASPDGAGVTGNCFNPESDVADWPEAVLEQAVRRRLYEAENRSAKSSHACAWRKDFADDSGGLPRGAAT